MKKIKILFVCKYNRFRSRIAEAYFKKINKNKSIEVKSAGIIMGSPINQMQINLANKFGINIKGKPQGISAKLLQWQDIIIIVADNVPPSIFNSKKYKTQLIVWKVPDKNTSIKLIMKKVDQLNKKFAKLK